MKLSELLKAIQQVQIIGSTEKDITGVNIDSRLVAAGHLFMAMRGTQLKIGRAHVSDGIVPSEVGMGAKDAVYLLESKGLRVRLNGIGKVRNQSIAGGSRLIKGQTIALTLR